MRTTRVSIMIALGDVNLTLGSVKETLVPGDQSEVVAPFDSSR
jgi:hypothetical protein